MSLTRPARPEDAAQVAPLIALSMGAVAEFLFSSPYRVLVGLFCRRRNRFSYQFAEVFQEDGQVRGVLVSYPAAVLEALALPTAWQMLSVLGVRAFLRFLPRAWELRTLREAEPGEYFVHSLATAPSFQRRGLGSYLLEQAEEKGRQAGLRWCSLTVSMDNTNALRFYLHRGYEIVETQRSELLAHAVHLPGFYRLRKTL